MEICGEDREGRGGKKKAEGWRIARRRGKAPPSVFSCFSLVLVSLSFQYLRRMYSWISAGWRASSSSSSSVRKLPGGSFKTNYPSELFFPFKSSVSSRFVVKQGGRSFPPSSPPRLLLLLLLLLSIFLLVDTSQSFLASSSSSSWFFCILPAEASREVSSSSLSSSPSLARSYPPSRFASFSSSSSFHRLSPASLRVPPAPSFSSPLRGKIFSSERLDLSPAFSSLGSSTTLEFFPSPSSFSSRTTAPFRLLPREEKEKILSSRLLSFSSSSLSPSSSPLRRSISSERLFPTRRSSLPLAPSAVCTPAFLPSFSVDASSLSADRTSSSSPLSRLASLSSSKTPKTSLSAYTSKFPFFFFFLASSPSISSLSLSDEISRSSRYQKYSSLKPLLFSSSSSSSFSSSSNCALSVKPLLRNPLSSLSFVPSSPQEKSSASSSSLSSLPSKGLQFFRKFLLLLLPTSASLPAHADKGHTPPSSSSPSSRIRNRQETTSKGFFSSFFSYQSKNRQGGDEEARRGERGILPHLVKTQTRIVEKMHHLWGVCTLHFGQKLSHVKLYLQELRVLLRPLLHLLLLHHKPLFFAAAILIRFFKILLYLRYLLDWLPQVNPHLLPFSFVYRTTDVYISIFTRLIPSIASMDLSGFAAWFVLEMVENQVNRVIATFG